MRNDLMRAAGLALAAILGSAGAAPGQYASAPFLESTVELSQALGLELIAARLMLMDRYDPPLEDELLEHVDEMRGSYWARFGASLQATNPELAEALQDALEDVARAAETGEDASAATAEAAALLRDARTALFDETLREAPAFQGALIVNLLLAEGGVAEGYEEAVEEPWEYSTGWAGLQRVEAIWSEIADLTSEERRRDAEEMIAALHELFPNPGPPQSVVGWNPEEAEAPAQRLAGIVEEVVSADLFPGRDLAALSGHLAATAEAGCAAFEAGDDARAVEYVQAVFELYDGHLAPAAQLFATEAHENATRHFSLILGIEEDDEDEEVWEGGDEGEEVDHETQEAEGATLSPADRCANLSAALRNIGSAIGG